nr:hypothetical protein asmbl_41 [uncultured bacterium]
MSIGTALTILLAGALVLWAIFWIVSSMRDLRALRRMPEWRRWRRTARTLNPADRFRVYLATVFGRRLRDPRLGRLAVQRGQAALAVVERARKEEMFGYWYRHHLLLVAGAVLTPLFLVGAVGNSLQRDWGQAALGLLAAAVLVPHWLVVDWRSDLTSRSVEGNRGHLSERHES